MLGLSERDADGSKRLGDRLWLAIGLLEMLGWGDGEASGDPVLTGLLSGLVVGSWLPLMLYGEALAVLDLLALSEKLGLCEPEAEGVWLTVWDWLADGDRVGDVDKEGL